MGKMAEHLIGVGKSGRLGKPSLQISAYVSTMPEASRVNERKFDKEDLARCKKEIAGIEKVLDTWVPEDVAARAKKSLERELASRKARLAELKARMKTYEDEDDDEDEEDED